MTAQWVSRTVRWPARVGLGLARSVILLVVSVLYPTAWVLAAGLVWLEATTVARGRWDTVAVLALFTGAIGVVVPSGPICGLLRLLVRRWTGTALAHGYRPITSIVRLSTGYWWNGYRYKRFRGVSRVNRWVHRQVRDPAAWHDRRALLAAPFGVGVVAALPVAGVAAGIWALTQTEIRLVGLLSLVAGIGTAPYVWHIAVLVLIGLLRPSPTAVLSQRVAQLTEQRADATAAQAAEIRRIERDLHDGAQARLVALGLALTTAERAVDRDPEQAKALLREAKATTSAALRELRELVRGITPPVLSERGLTDALRALALDTPLPVSVEAEPGFDTRLDAPIESALYFGTAELLTNAVKHAHASSVTIRLCRQRDTVVVEVADNGRGDATSSATGGLAGLRRRLAVFDGKLSLDSPAGGPTRARMVVPWTSS
ncbi:sensor histidine kinase [Actinocrispum wychmicini]|uniref:histidine kinase n=1 Tax=Actinocrispum wychmicini TaxID=1213861 RepID=A0A4R2JK87_9PSEU|nr:histidine kinase [Actinocrispum wychmicini]TCO59564.1 signal transduction histidine kinase [Actinocrispum wychmicini]